MRIRYQYIFLEAPFLATIGNSPDIDEVEPNDPRTGAEDHRRLLDEKIVDDGFEFSGRDGAKLGKRVVIRVGSTSSVGDGLTEFLIDSSLRKRLVDNPEVEGSSFVSGYRKLR